MTESFRPGLSCNITQARSWERPPPLVSIDSTSQLLIPASRHLQVMREMTIVVIEGLTFDWRQPPEVRGHSISGSAVLSNQAGHALHVTVIVVAVNQIGRSTALGYQHFVLAAQTKSPVIPFASSPGKGTYTVRGDAAAHRKNSHHIFRVSKQTPDSLHITQF